MIDFTFSEEQEMFRKAAREFAETMVQPHVAEMEKTGADNLFVLLPGATHGFTNPMATENGRKYGLPLRYSELADCASWDHMQLVLQSAFE